MFCSLLLFRVVSGTGIAIYYDCDARITGAEGRREMKKWLNNIRSRISAWTSAKLDDSRWQETTAMVYDGDIYAVLLRDRAARRLSQADDHHLDYRRDASWPFIR